MQKECPYKAINQKKCSNDMDINVFVIFAGTIYCFSLQAFCYKHFLPGFVTSICCEQLLLAFVICTCYQHLLLAKFVTSIFVTSICYKHLLLLALVTSICYQHVVTSIIILAFCYHKTTNKYRDFILPPGAPSLCIVLHGNSLIVRLSCFSIH